MSEKMREEFEEWFIDNYCYGAGPVNNGSPVAIAAWQAWQASRAALVVELPSFENGSIRGYSGDCEEANMVVDAVAESLDASGVSYK